MKIIKTKGILLSTILLVAGHSCVMAQESTSKITASVFYETFDGCCDVGGNDGVLSNETERHAAFVTDNEWDKEGSVYRGAQCIRLKGISKKEVARISLKAPITFQEDISGFMEFRAILWGSSSKSSLYCNLSGPTYSFTTCDIQREQFTSYKVEFSNIKKNRSYFFHKWV